MVKANLKGPSGYQGKREDAAYKRGEGLSRKQSMLAKCYDCMGHYEDGKADCEIVQCSLYPYMPYVDKAHKHRSNRVITPENLKRMTEARKGKHRGNEPTA